jgi:hypothetical protein
MFKIPEEAGETLSDAYGSSLAFSSLGNATQGCSPAGSCRAFYSDVTEMRECQQGFTGS